MLVEFRIRNFALIDDVTVGLEGGLNVFSGETGAGKSVIVTALSLLLGARPSGSLVRSGCASARLDAVFHYKDPDINSILEQAGVEPEDDAGLALAREFSDAGRTTARINTRAVPLSTLKAVAERLADLHGQYAHQTMLRTSDHAEFLDATGGAAHKKALRNMAHAFEKMRNARARLAELRDSSDQIQQEAELLRFRIEEIDSLISSPEEYPELEQEINTLEHSHDLSEAAHKAYEEISRSGPETTALNSMAAALNALDPVRGIDPALDDIISQIEEADAVLDTAARSLAPLSSQFEHDPVRLEELRERLYQIKQIMKKTESGTIDELFKYREAGKKRLDDISLDEEGMEKLAQEVAGLDKAAVDAARKLSKSRSILSASFGKKMQTQLKDLAMPGAVFEAALAPFDEGEHAPAGKGGEMILRAAGAERVEFRISPNPGEPPRPLALTASGGELSRVMLAFKSLLRGADYVPVLVFDEIDAGIGGETAHSIAGKLKDLSRDKQILCVTHLPQIAAAADHHIRIRKRSSGARTIIGAEQVSGDKRLREMTRMLGATGMQESEELARKLMQQAGGAKRKH